MTELKRLLRKLEDNKVDVQPYLDRIKNITTCFRESGSIDECREEYRQVIGDLEVEELGLEKLKSKFKGIKKSRKPVKKSVKKSRKPVKKSTKKPVKKSVKKSLRN